MRVEFPRDQTCCGQPNFNAGLRDEARPIAEHTIRVFEDAEGDVVIPSGSCAHMMRHNYPELFADDPSGCRAPRRWRNVSSNSPNTWWTTWA